MWRMPQPSGGCHSPDYVGVPKLPAILGPDIDGADSIPVIRPATSFVRAGENPTLGRRFAPMPTGGTRLAGIMLVLQHHLHAMPLGFVREIEAGFACRPLMNLLIRHMAFAVVLSDVAHIANHQRLHPSYVEGGDKFAGLLMLDVPYLMLEFCQLFALGADKAPAASAPLLFVSISAESLPFSIF